MPIILGFNEPWIDKLLEVELNVNSDNGECLLHSLLKSTILANFNFECPRFVKLFQMQMNCIEIGRASCRERV